VVLPGEIRPREGRAWLAGRQGTRGVLRRLPAPAAAAADLTEDVTWLHGFLARLAGAGFPSPRPLPCFDGRSWTIAGGWLWEIVSFLPGRAVGWAAVPPMEEIGALLGRYHAAARQDLPRIRRFLRGYAGVVPLTPAQASVIPLYLRGRGLQMIAKRVRAGSNDTAMLAEVLWLTANAGQVADALVAALP